MPLYKGNKNINAIYKGTTQISAIYKGTILVYSSAFWQSLFYSYLYNDLIPTTINNKNVLDKAKVSKIYANGVIENQIAELDLKTDTFTGGSAINVPNQFFASYIQDNTNGMTFTSVAFTGRYNLGYGITQNKNETYYRIINGHKYLLFAYAKSSVSNVFKCQFSINSITAGLTNIGTSWTLFAGLITSNITNNSPLLYFGNIADIPANETISIKDWSIIDLTLMFGAGNEPTTLTDNRIQKILNQGYIAYNTGTYKGTSISEFSSKDSNSVDLDTLSFIYQGNANDTTHDTYELTKTSHIFTKNVDYVDETTMPTTRSTPQVITIPRKRLGIVDLGSLNWTYTSGTYSRFVAIINNIKPVSQVSDLGNIYCSNFITDSVSHIYSHTKDKSIGVHNSASIWVYDSEYTNVADFKNAMAGQYLFYETNAEVSDIADTITIEAGGSITSDSEVLPDVEFSVKCK